MVCGQINQLATQLPLSLTDLVLYVCEVEFIPMQAYKI